MSDTEARASDALQRFITDLRDLWRHEPDMQRRMEAAKPLLETLLRCRELQEISAHWPSTEGRKNLLLHADPDHGFVINAVVREPNRKGSVHDHAGAWVLYGMLTGTERLERYDRIDDHRSPGQARVVLSSVTQGIHGRVDLVPPYAIHAEQGGPGRSVAIILRSQPLGEGTVLQHSYDPIRQTVVERYGPTQILFHLTS